MYSSEFESYPDSSVQWILPRRSKDHNLSLHNVIILAKESAGESACVMYASTSFPSQMSILDLDIIIIIAGEFVCFRLRLTMVRYHALRPTYETVWKKIITFLITDKTSLLHHTRSRSSFVTNVYSPGYLTTCEKLTQEKECRDLQTYFRSSHKVRLAKVPSVAAPRRSYIPHRSFHRQFLWMR